MAALSPRLFKDLECWSGRDLNQRPPARQTGAYQTELTGRDVMPEEMLWHFVFEYSNGDWTLLRYKDFWSTDPILSHLWFPSIMARDRFLQVLYYLHLNNNQNDTGKEKLFKLRSVLDHLVRQCKKHYHPRPRREVSVDEQMIGAKVSFPTMVIFFFMPKTVACRTAG